MKIGFAIIAEQEFLEQIVSFETKFHDRAGFLNHLGTVHNLPHITLFQGEMKEAINYCNIADEIASEYVRRYANRRLIFTNIEYVPDGWYFLLCKKNAELLSLHYHLLKEVYPYIILPENRLDRRVEELTEEQYNAILQYNYRYAGEAYYPHITIGRSLQKDNLLLKEMNRAKEYLNLLPRAERITVYKMGENGTHEDTLYEVKL